MQVNKIVFKRNMINRFDKIDCLHAYIVAK